MKKKILIAMLAVIGIGLISGCIIFKDEIGKVKQLIYPIGKKQEEKNISSGTKELSITNEDETSSQTMEKLEEKKENVENDNKSDNKSNNNVSNNSTQNTKDVSKNSNKNVTNKNKQNNNSNNTQNNKSNNSNNNPTTVTPKEETKQKTPWEELGLTEDQYMNQPMYSWEEVDFKTKDECMNYGNEHAEYGFECSEVTSWTRSLGWDYKTF